ncbi:MAG: Rps23 Pro-64 3,4-dihydroxylase Tpa1-like proline 4-hydroxylase [Candidatus Azotimanducaceae bacterium]|jgi:Rps23 Pro-64 3,4-dihydroxylase Tpa1-like proline 4-hydroxylase
MVSLSKHTVFATSLKDASARHHLYMDEAPFPHAVLDSLIDPDILRRVIKEVPTPHEAARSLFSADVRHLQELKFAFRDADSFGLATQQLLFALQSKPFLEFLTNLTGIRGLIPDPYLHGAGFHQILRGGKLSIHADFNMHPELGLRRRVNLLLYLNEGWQDNWEGCLELWNQDMSACVKSISPIFNRMVIFNTSDVAFHGHPRQLRCPTSKVRQSLALYYYSSPTPEESGLRPHSTLWQDRPEDEGTVSSAVEKFVRGD